MSLKRFLTIAFIAFVIYFAFTRPQVTADGVKAVLAWFPVAADRLATFFTEVLS